MRIVFLCGSLEPGRDGVGDYTRRLAGQLIRNGYKVSAIALNDFHISEQYAGLQDAEGVGLSVLRLPASKTAEHRFKTAKQWIDDFDPIWLSLQFVPFAFHHKGLPFRLIKFLAKMGRGRRWHLMFHELWVGMNVEASQKEKFWGFVQKKIIVYLVQQLMPKIVHTQSHLYHACLTKLGITSMLLPLFSNIFVSSIKKSGVYDDAMISINNTIRIVFFGSIHAGGPILQFAKEVASCTNNRMLNTEVVFIGLAGKEQAKWKEIFIQEGVTVKCFGEQTHEIISKVLSTSNIGVSTTPMLLADKSGTIAAMREHGLPVLCLSGSWTPPDYIFLSKLDGISEYSSGAFEKLISNVTKHPADSNLTTVANLFDKTVLLHNI